MRTLFASFALFATAFTAAAPAQVQVFGGNAPRASAFKVWFAENAPAGMVCIQYGQPEWKSEYDAMLGAKGKSFRLGKDYWATFTTDVELMIGKTKVPAGGYFLGLHCDKEGKLGLAVMEMGKAIKAKSTPFDPTSWKVDMFLPMDHKKVDESTKQLTFAMEASDKNPMHLTLMLSWGGHVLHTPMKVVTGNTGSKPAASKPTGR